jgi:hypothetical protein
VLQNTPDMPELRLGETVLSAGEFTHNTSKFDVTFILSETPEGLKGSVEYCTDLFLLRNDRTDDGRIIKRY